MRPSIVTFLDAVLTAEAERQRDPSTQWHDKDCEAVPDVLYPDRETGACTCGVPERVLAEIEARRALLDEHQDVNHGDCGTCVDGSWGYPVHGGSSPQPHPCRTLRLLAQPYANRLGYDETWRLPDDERTATVHLDNRDARFAPTPHQAIDTDPSSRRVSRWLEDKAKELMRSGITEMTEQLRAEQQRRPQPGV